jgi:hypothetical protein
MLEYRCHVFGKTQYQTKMTKDMIGCVVDSNELQFPKLYPLPITRLATPKTMNSLRHFTLPPHVKAKKVVTLFCIVIHRCLPEISSCTTNGGFYLGTEIVIILNEKNLSIDGMIVN